MEEVLEAAVRHGGPVIAVGESADTYKKEIFSNKFEVTSDVAILLIMCYNQTRYRYLEGEHSWNYVYLIK